jgi:hypothetical protein
MYPKRVNIILIKRSVPHPRSRKTPTGGKKRAIINLQMSPKVIAMLNVNGKYCIPQNII